MTCLVKYEYDLLNLLRVVTMLLFYPLYFIVFLSDVSKNPLFICYRCTSVDQWAVAFEARVSFRTKPILYFRLSLHPCVVITLQLQFKRVKHTHNTHRLVHGQRHYYWVHVTFYQVQVSII